MRFNGLDLFIVRQTTFEEVVAMANASTLSFDFMLVDIDVAQNR